MTNKFYRKDAIINVYVVNLEEYDKYNLIEDYTNLNPTEGWVSLPINKEDWKEFIKTIGNPEEIVIHDYENNSGVDGLEIKEHENIEDLNKLAETLENLTPYEITIVNALDEVLGYFEDALDCFESEDYCYYRNMTIEEVAQEYIEGAYYIPEYLENYIDYKAIARDMLLDRYYETSYGVIEIL